MFNQRIQLSPEQEKQLDELLSKKVGNRYMITGEEARLIKAQVTQDIQKGVKLDQAAVRKALDTIRDTLPKIN